MQRYTIVAVTLVGLVVGGQTNVANAQDCCVHRPILAASAWLVRGAVRLVTLPVRLVVSHHGCGHCCYGHEVYGPAYPYEMGAYPVGPAAPAVKGELKSIEDAPAAPAATTTLGRPAAVYTAVATDSIDQLSAEDRHQLASLAIGRGLGHYRHGEFAVAEQYFAEATNLSPEMAAAWGLRGAAAAASQDMQVAAECATRVGEISAASPAERSQLYRLLAPMQGESRVAFEQLVRGTNQRNPVESIAQNR